LLFGQVVVCLVMSSSLIVGMKKYGCVGASKKSQKVLPSCRKVEYILIVLMYMCECEYDEIGHWCVC
jgi:hypothetical protein